jgi:phosphoglycerate kinase
MPGFRTLDDLFEELPSGGRVLMRVDLNSPIEDDAVVDNRRFDRHAGTVEELLERGYAVALLAHQGRPGGAEFVSLSGHADVLAEHLGRPVAFVEDTHGERALAAVRGLEAGEVCLLENVRMADDELPERPPEEHAESDLVRALAPEFDAYVNDAYSAAHRSHASLVGFAPVMDAYAGRVMETEYEANTAIAAREFDGPVTMVLGGTKATDVVGVMRALDGTVDRFLLGGITGELFLRAAGHDVGYDVAGTDLFDDQWEENAETVAAVLDEFRERIHLPRDLAYEAGTGDGDDGERAEIPVEGVEKSRPLLDVGHDTVEAYRPFLEESAAVFVKGALGLFEDERFAYGTVETLRTIGDADCFSVVGGGDTSGAIDRYGLDSGAFSHVSIAGGAYLRALTGEPLPAVEMLERATDVD